MLAQEYQRDIKRSGKCKIPFFKLNISAIYVLLLVVSGYVNVCVDFLLLVLHCFLAFASKFLTLGQPLPRYLSFVPTEKNLKVMIKHYINAQNAKHLDNNFFLPQCQEVKVKHPSHISDYQFSLRQNWFVLQCFVDVFSGLVYWMITLVSLLAGSHTCHYPDIHRMLTHSASVEIW